MSGEASGVDGRAGTVLVTEDEPGIRQLVRRILELDGYRVLVAHDGEEALRIADEQGPIDLLITDIVMPRMSGRELVALLGAKHPSVKALFISGLSEDEGPEGDGEAAAEYLPKPFDADQLLDKVRGVLEDG